MKANVGWLRHLSQIGDTVMLLKHRQDRIDRAPAASAGLDAIAQLARRLHPPAMNLRIMEVREETPDTRTFRLAPDTRTGTDSLPFFRAGQYLVVRETIEDVPVTRPYSIASTPDDALHNGFLELTIRARQDGFFAPYVWKHWHEGHTIKAKGPFGTFYYERLRDARDIVGLAGGAGITPLRAIARDLIAHHPDTRVTLVHAVERYEEAIYRDELETLNRDARDRFAYHLVCRKPSGRKGVRTGLLSRRLLEKIIVTPRDKSFFLCGPPGMYAYLEDQLRPWSLPPRRIRRESFGLPDDVARLPGFPSPSSESYTLTVHVAGETHRTVARYDEPLLIALERAGLTPPAVCRSGLCGACDALLLSGTVYVRPDGDGRRAALKAAGHIHLCSTWPNSDVVVRIPRGDW